MNAPSDGVPARMKIDLPSELRQYGNDTRAHITAPVYLTVPMALFEPHEAQAQKNHGQSLRRLNARGGLSASEACAIIEDRPWHRMTDNDAYATLAKHVEALTSRAPSPIAQEMGEALEYVRSIISDGAMVGFNPLGGNWAERLFASQQVTMAALKRWKNEMGS